MTFVAGAYGGFYPQSMTSTSSPQKSSCKDCQRYIAALEAIIALPLGQRSAHYVYEGIARDALKEDK